MADTKNALAELAKRLRNGLYINPNDKRFDGPVIVRTLDANDVLAAQRIVAELAKAEKPIELRTVGMTHLADILKADKNRAVEIARNCRAIAEEGEEDESK